MKKQFFHLLLFLFFTGSLKAQPLCQFSHYSTEDGLPQYTIMDMLQDHKGFMWFATWDGLSKYDGFEFKNYKVGVENNYIIKSNRVQKIWEDKSGNIWFNSYDGEIHCLNPKTETFWGTQYISEFKENKFRYTQISIQNSGHVWLLSENDGCILVEDSLFNYKIFNTDNKTLKSNHVNQVFEDKNQNCWILTENGLVKKNNDELKYYFYSINQVSSSRKQSFYSAFETDNEIIFGSRQGKIWKYTPVDGKFSYFNTPFSSNIVKILQANESQLIVISENQGFMILNKESNAGKVFNTSNTPALKSQQITSTFLDKSGNFWFDTNAENGIYKFNIASGTFQYFKVKIDDASVSFLPPFSFVFEDINGRIWVQPKGGGFSMYNKNSGLLEPFYNDPASPKRKFSNIIHSAMSDRQGNLWMCTRSHGLEKIIFNKNYFKHFPVNSGFYAENSNDVRAVFEDSYRRLWVATKDKRISLFDQNKKLLGRISPNGRLTPDALWDGMVYSILQTKNGDMWMGTKGEGLFRLKKTSFSGQFKVEKFINISSDPYSISDNNIYSIFEDNRGHIWVGTYSGGLNLVQTDSSGKIRFINFNNEMKQYPVNEALRVRFITQSKQGNICLGTTGGLVMFQASFDNPSAIRFRYFSRIPGNIESLSNNDIHGICITGKGEMFLATFGGGINKVTKMDKQGFPLSFKAYTSKNGLPSDVTLAILEDEQGKLWFSNENNLSKFNPETENIETYSEIKGLMSANSFSEASTCQLNSNEMVFGFSKGLLTFYPAQIINSNFKPYIALTNFQLFNVDQKIGENSPLPVQINDLPKLVLKHNQNFFTIEYAALDFINPENIVFAYYLEGFDNDWNYVQKQRKANYTNLPKGTYIFRVKSTNSEGVWMDNERQLKIIVKPSFWETPWAYIMYFLLVMGIIYSIIRILLTFYHLRNNIELEKKLSNLKLRFFTDISHEIRTPLTMITAPIDLILQDSKTPDSIKKQLQSVSHNTGRLLRLVNQILDFRKIQFMHLKVYETELAHLVQDVCENFTDIALSKNITFRFSDNSGGAKVWVDPDCVDKIVMNLLSNAFKFTPEKRMIQVIVTSDEKTVSVQVKDEGPGLPKEKQKNLFTRFASFNSDKSKPSTGIGLSMVKDLVDKHAARIQVESDEQNGTSFTVTFMKGISHFDKMVEIVATGNEKSLTEIEIKQTDGQDNTEDSLHSGNSEKQAVLIVEDDTDLRNFIKTMLEDEYLVFEAENGKEGLELAQKDIPDFIVSDIMMPEMDGIELLQALKTNVITSHIPVVLLTAKTTIESKLEGLTYGADDYITKPFSVSYFKARIANLIAQRKHLQEIFRTNPESFKKQVYEPQPFTITSHDESLMNSVLQVIEENMENFEFTVDVMRENIGMSRSAFFKKIKSLTGLAPVEFVRDIKMKRAAQLLSSGQYRVKEVTYMVGFSDSKYFAKCFREKFGVTPMEFKQNS